MRIIIGGQYYATPDGSSVRISKSMSDPVPTCALNIVDNASAINITPPQEILVLDDQVIPNPAVNLLQNPQLNPYNGNGWQAGGVGTNSQNAGGGLQAIFSNAPAGQSNATLIQSTPFNGVIPGQTYTFSYFASGSGINNIQLLIQIIWQGAPGTGSTTNTQIYTILGGTNRYTITAVCPANTVSASLNVGVNVTNATNSGTIIYTQMQFEPNWFPTLSYPTPWVGPNQTNCQQLPLGLYIRQYRKFAGFVTKVSPGDYHGNVRTIQVSANGYAWLAGTIFGNDTFSSKTDAQIITTLLGKYFLSSGTAMTTTANVVTGVTVSNLQLNWDDLRTAFDGLCGLSGFYWTIDYYWNFIYAPPGYFSMAIALICDNSSAPDMVTTFPAYNFKPDYDFTQPGSNILTLGNSTNTAQVIDPSRIAQLGILTGYSLPSTTSWMRKVNDSTLNSVADCTQRGMAELIQYDNVRGIYHLSANVELLAGEGIRVTSNTDNLNQTMLLLQQVSAQWLGTSEMLTDVWEYSADLGATNRAVTNIISRIYRQTQKNTSAPAISTTTLAVLENVSVIDQVDSNSAYAEAVLADSPSAYWRLGEPAGFSITSAYDWGGTTQTGTYTGGFTLGQTGALYNDSDTAVLFNGSTGYVSLPNAIIAANHDLTLEMWVNVPSFAADGGGVQRRLFIDNIDNTNAFQMATQAVDTSFVWAVNDSTGQVISSHQGFSTNTWYHVVGTWVAGTRTAQLYVNGVAQSNAGATGFGIGSIATNIARRTDSTGYFPGTVDEVAVYSTALSAARILAHYNYGKFGHA